MDLVLKTAALVFKDGMENRVAQLPVDVLAPAPEHEIGHFSGLGSRNDAVVEVRMGR